MTNAELIKALRCCASIDTPCKGLCPYHGAEYCSTKKDLAAANALEAAEQRISELSLDCELFQQKCMELEARMPKEGECEAKKPKTVKETRYSFYCDCPTCGGRLISNVDGEWCAGSFDRFCRMCGQKIDWSEYCGWSNKPNCGADGERRTDEQQ